MQKNWIVRKMKKIFIVNPSAGARNCEKDIQKKLIEKNIEDYEIYVTKCKGDATKYVSQRCEESKEDLLFISCGGDGTLNEVASGCVGHPNAVLSVYPCGSGNDYVKYYGDKSYFLDFDKMLNGKEDKIDIIKVGDRYAVNACHFGFDSKVAKTMTNVKYKKVIGGKNAYNTGVFVALMTAMKNKCRVIADGEELNKKCILLCTVTNGKYVGGSYKCAPRSKNNDGLMEVCCISPVSRLKFIKLINTYKNGLHLDDASLVNVLKYRQAKKVEIIAEKPDFPISLDGEIIEGGRFEVEILQQAVRFLVPQGIEEAVQ